MYTLIGFVTILLVMLVVCLTGGWMCRIRRLLMMGAGVPETCRAE
jgi:hypothetical protein